MKRGGRLVRMLELLPVYNNATDTWSVTPTWYTASAVHVGEITVEGDFICVVVWR